MKQKSVNVNMKALKLIHSFCRRWFPLMTVQNILEVFSPYLNLIISSSLLNEISGNRNKNTMITWMSFLVIGNFLVLFLTRTNEKFLSQAVYEREKKESRILGIKHMHIDYRTVEGTEYRQLRRRVDENASMNGNGKYALLTSVDSIEYNILNLMVAVYLFIDMLVRIFANRFDYRCLIFLMLITILAICNIWISSWRQKKEIYMADKGAVMLTDENRYDDAIDSYHMGKDVRIYRQDRKILAMKEKYLITDHVKHFKWMFQRVFRYSIPLSGISYLLKFSIYIFIIYYIHNGSIEIGGLIKYVGFVEMFSSSITKLVTRIGAIKENEKYIADYLKLFEYDSTERDRGEPLEKMTSVSSIEFIDVSFHYPENERYIFRHLSFQIHGNSKVAIVGMNGSGKTTMIKLICRLYKPTEGEIKINGRNIWDIRYDEYISLITAVFQDFKLFSFSLGQNVALSSYYDEQKVMTCIQKAGLADRFMDMPYGVNTYIYKDFDEEGIEISGGEAQKIAIARALYKDAPIVILDEPTSALDPVSEYEIYKKFDGLAQNKLAIYISHRLSSCRFCDDIIVLDNGQIVQRGNHDLLLIDEESKYYELWNAQAKYYLNNPT